MQVETLPLSFLMDLKFMAMSVGISQAGGRHSCPYCTGHKNAEGHWIEGPLKSLEGVEKDHENWLEETNGDENKLKNYNYNFENYIKSKLKIVDMYVRSSLIFLKSFFP